MTLEFSVSHGKLTGYGEILQWCACLSHGTIMISFTLKAILDDRSGNENSLTTTRVAEYLQLRHQNAYLRYFQQLFLRSLQIQFPLDRTVNLLV